jgi:hypothetical protein
MRVFRQCVVGSALVLCLGLLLGPMRAQDFRPLPKFKLENASQILYAPYIKNHQLSWWFDGEPLKAVLKDSAAFGMGLWDH